MQIPANPPTDPTIANANNPVVNLLDGDDFGTIDGGGADGNDVGANGVNIEALGPQGLQMFPEPEHNFSDRGYKPHSLQEDCTHGPGKTSPNGSRVPEALGHPGPQHIIEKSRETNPQLKLEPETIDSKKTP